MNSTPKDNSLGSNAQKFVKDFSQSSDQRMADGNAAGEPTGSLYHYTSEDALYTIISSGVFRFSSILTMDDETELTYGWNIAQLKMKDALQTKDPIERGFLEELVNEEDIEKIKKWIDFYSISFGQRDIAEQWVDYGNDMKGVSFGLKPQFFIPAPFEDPNNLQDYEHVFLVKSFMEMKLHSLATLL